MQSCWQVILVHHDQASYLRWQMDRRNGARQAKTICVVSGKGGVGKTNFAVNFALELTKQKKRVLVFDLDVGMGNVDLLLGRNAKKTIIDMFRPGESIHDIIEIGPHQLHYIAGGSGLNELFKMDSARKDYFLKQMEEVTFRFDYIIFDIGAGIHADSLFFILAADECIVITTPEPTSITDAYSVIKHILQQNTNIPIRFVLNRAVTKKHGEKVVKQFQQVVKKFLQIDIRCIGMLPDDKTVSQSVMRQVPFTIAAEKSSAAKAVKEIASAFVADSKEYDKSRTASFIQRLKRFFSEE